VGIAEWLQRIKTQALLRSADTAAITGLARFRSDQYVQGRWLANAHHQPIDQLIDLAA
jgi:hypothetical protein